MNIKVNLIITNIIVFYTCKITQCYCSAWLVDDQKYKIYKNFSFTNQQSLNYIHDTVNQYDKVIENQIIDLTKIKNIYYNKESQNLLLPPKLNNNKTIDTIDSEIKKLRYLKNILPFVQEKFFAKLMIEYGFAQDKNLVAIITYQLLHRLIENRNNSQQILSSHNRSIELMYKQRIFNNKSFLISYAISCSQKYITNNKNYSYATIGLMLGKQNKISSKKNLNRIHDYGIYYTHNININKFDSIKIYTNQLIKIKNWFCIGSYTEYIFYKHYGTLYSKFAISKTIYENKNNGNSFNVEVGLFIQRYTHLQQLKKSGINISSWIEI
ncbi:hypothetical protein [Rickettsia endosymbiont of Cardiosporidium cionae]|uniref:hypothetical protein n=1 Tax=Rickettsia endosymbiont of Cardiosporidium cionae TaxID=2777155 RepID=UPI001895CF0D|nr:hypothetical protein [Rickettsia endosymbiont of Cardiosporidium cionae]KAF8818843.1 hypothetical protein IHI24_000077 [Rickettsia endosymbiont of Cardiosporidium cionae]